MSEPLIAALVLAAGSSKRFGTENKLLANIGGKPVLESVLSNLTDCELDAVVVVIAPDQSEIAALVQSAGFTSVVNSQAVSGMGSSIACGMKHLSEQTTESFSGVAIYLGDMPSIRSDISRQLMEEFKRANGEKIVRPVYTADQKNTPGHPVIFPSDLFTELEGLTGDAGAKQLISENCQRLIEVVVSDRGATKDIDTVEELIDDKKISDKNISK